MCNYSVFVLFEPCAVLPQFKVSTFVDNHITINTFQFTLYYMHYSSFAILNLNSLAFPVSSVSRHCENSLSYFSVF